MTFNLNKIWLEDGIILKERNELIVALTVSFPVKPVKTGLMFYSSGTRYPIVAKKHENSFSNILITLRTQLTQRLGFFCW